MRCRSAGFGKISPHISRTSLGLFAVTRWWRPVNTRLTVRSRLLDHPRRAGRPWPSPWWCCPRGADTGAGAALAVQPGAGLVQAGPTRAGRRVRSSHPRPALPAWPTRVCREFRRRSSPGLARITAVGNAAHGCRDRIELAKSSQCRAEESQVVNHDRGARRSYVGKPPKRRLRWLHLLPLGRTLPGEVPVPPLW